MKIGIVCFWDRRATPYLEKYEIALRAEHIEYDVLFWERDGGVNQKDTCELEKSVKIKCGTSLIKKLISFFLWKISISRIIKQNNYDYLIILTTYPAILLMGLLLDKYKAKYIFDIRDYTQEKCFVYRQIVMCLVDASCFTTISSKGFFSWLAPSDKIIVNHNITVTNQIETKQLKLKCKQPLTVSFVGNVRLDNQTRALLLTLANNNKYMFEFWGRILPDCDIIEFCNEHNIRNIKLCGEFDVRDKGRIYEGVDLINAVYANGKNRLSFGDSTPLPNRLYDAIVFHRPIIASKGTYLAQLIDQYSIGFNINGFDPAVEKQFDEFVDNFSWDKFKLGCSRLLSVVLSEENDFRSKLHNILGNWRSET